MENTDFHWRKEYPPSMQYLNLIDKTTTRRWTISIWHLNCCYDSYLTDTTRALFCLYPKLLFITYIFEIFQKKKYWILHQLCEIYGCNVQRIRRFFSDKKKWNHIKTLRESNQWKSNHKKGILCCCLYKQVFHFRERKWKQTDTRHRNIGLFEWRHIAYFLSVLFQFSSLYLVAYFTFFLDVFYYFYTWHKLTVICTW